MGAMRARVVGIAMLVCAVVLGLCGIFVWPAPETQHRTVILSAGPEFRNALALGFALALMPTGALVAIMAGAPKVRYGRVFWVVVAIAAVTVGFLGGPYLLAVRMGRGDAWVEQVQRPIDWAFMAMNFALLISQFWALWRKGKGRATEPTGS